MRPVTCFVLGCLFTLLLPAPPGAAAGRCFGKAPTILGTKGGDKLRGTPGNDVIMSKQGNDVIRGRGGHDRICSGTGFDKILAGGGNDRILGGHGIDELRGWRGDDVILVGSTECGDCWMEEQWESAHGEAGHDRLVGWRNPNNLYGGPGRDIIEGRGFWIDGANETLDGGTGPDLIRSSGSAGGEVFLIGGPGDDQLTGGEASEDLQGGSGDDALDGGGNGNHLDGGEGWDSCVNGTMENCEE